MNVVHARATPLLSILVLLSACGGGGGGGGTGAETLQETGRMVESQSAQWWLNSGALFDESGGGGSTIQGDLRGDSPWHRRYASSNPADSDGGSHPQNVFRLVRRQILANPHQEMTFVIDAVRKSPSANRNQSNGVLLMSRYIDGDNLYYAGVRVDGAAVIKRKRHGSYVTLASARIYPGAYDRDRDPNLIPEGRPIRLAADTFDDGGGAVVVRLFVDGALVLEAADGGGAALREPGYVGIRTDFMDVTFSGYQVDEIR